MAQQHVWIWMKTTQKILGHHSNRTAASWCHDSLSWWQWVLHVHTTLKSCKYQVVALRKSWGDVNLDECRSDRSCFGLRTSHRPEGNCEMKSGLIESSQLSLSQIITALFLCLLHKVVHRERVTLESQLELLRPVASTWPDPTRHVLTVPLFLSLILWAGTGYAL